MTKAALEVEMLNQILRKTGGDLTGLPAQYYKRAAKLIDDIWFVLGEQNYRFDWVEGKRPFGTRLINWYVDQVLDCAHYDQEAFNRFMQVYHFNNRYTSLFTPAMLSRVLKHTMTKNWRHVYKPAPLGVIRKPIVLD